jgi:BolA protein
MSVAAAIEEKLRRSFAPVRLEIVDESHLHAGHAGARPGGESHFRIEIVAERFAGLTRLARQRLVHEVLAEELAGPVHALSVSALAPGEATRTPRRGR